MKKSILLLAVLALGLLNAGCGTLPGSIEESFTVDGVTAQVAGDQLQVNVTHHGKLTLGNSGWSFQVFIDADNNPSTGYNGAEFMVNGVEPRYADGFVVRKVQPQGLSWGPEVGFAGSDDGSRLSMSIPLSMIAPTQAPAGVTFAAFVHMKGMYHTSITASAQPIARQ